MTIRNEKTISDAAKESNRKQAELVRKAYARELWGRIRIENGFGGLYIDGSSIPMDKSQLMDLITAECEKARREGRGKLRSSMKLKKPTHGACCTCQTCGFDNDSCECYENSRRVLKSLDKLDHDGTK